MRSSSSPRGCCSQWGCGSRSAANASRDQGQHPRAAADGASALSLAVGTVGGIYEIGGGSILAPILLAFGYSAYEVAPATLAATFLTSIAGIVTYQVLRATHGGAIAPDWALGAFLGAGGFLGSYVGARLQRRLPERSRRRLLGLIACLVAARYVQTNVQPAANARAVHARTH